MTPQQYQRICLEQDALIKHAQKTKSLALSMTINCPIPENVRPATVKDVQVGIVLWYPDSSWEQKWKIVEDLIEPDRPREPLFKWFYSEGSRYGIEGAFVED